MEKAAFHFVLPAIAACGLLISAAYGAESEPSLGQQFIDGHNTLTVSILVPFLEHKRVEQVTVKCDEGKCRVRVVSVPQISCGGSASYASPIQVYDHGPETDGFFTKVTPDGDAMLNIQYIDGMQETRLRVLLRLWKSPDSGIASGGVVGEADASLTRPLRFEPITEIVGTSVICHVRFQSR